MAGLADEQYSPTASPCCFNPACSGRRHTRERAEPAQAAAVAAAAANAPAAATPPSPSGPNIAHAPRPGADGGQIGPRGTAAARRNQRCALVPNAHPSLRHLADSNQSLGIGHEFSKSPQSLQLDGKPFGVKAGKYLSAASRLRTPFLSILPPRAVINTGKSTMARTTTALLCLLAAAISTQACSTLYFAQEEHLQAHHRSLLAVRRPGRGAGGRRSGQLGAAGGGVTTISARWERRRRMLSPCAGGWRLELQEQRC